MFGWWQKSARSVYFASRGNPMSYADTNIFVLLKQYWHRISVMKNIGIGQKKPYRSSFTLNTAFCFVMTFNQKLIPKLQQ